MSNERSFVWAKGATANVIEPLEYLKENGWRFGEVPMASNFNWLFKTLTEEMATIKKDIFTIREDINLLRERMASELDSLRTSTTSEILVVKKSVSNLDERTTNTINALTHTMTEEFAAVKTNFDGVRLDAAKTKEKANDAFGRTIGHNYALIQLGFVGKKICHRLREMEADLTKLVPGYARREWPADESFSAVPHEEGGNDDE